MVYMCDIYTVYIHQHIHGSHATRLTDGLCKTLEIFQMQMPTNLPTTDLITKILCTCCVYVLILNKGSVIST